MRSTGKDEVSDRVPRLVATDFFSLYRPSECELRVWLRQQGAEEAPPGPYARVLMDLGLEHERRHLTRFPDHIDLGRLPIAERAERTAELVAEGERVIYQGALRAETTLAGTEVEIVGVPDFLLPARSGYAIRDSKLARRIVGRYRAIELQLATYGWLYEQTFGEPPVALQVHNGAGEIVDIPYEGGDEALETLERILRVRLAADEPHETVGMGKCGSCGFFERCWPPAVERRSVGLLPWSGSLAGELERRGVETIDQLLERYDAELARRGRAAVGQGHEEGRRAGGRAAPRRRPRASRGPPDRPPAARDPRAPELRHVRPRGNAAPARRAGEDLPLGDAGLRREPGRVPRRHRRLRPPRRPRGLGGVPRRGGGDLRRARRHPVRPLGQLRATRRSTSTSTATATATASPPASRTTSSTCSRSPTTPSPSPSPATASRPSRPGSSRSKSRR